MVCTPFSKRWSSVILVLLATGCWGCLAASSTQDLEPFNTISVCAPVNVLVVPSTNGASQIRIEADTSSSISATVSGSVLSIETTGSMQAKGDIKVTVSLPATALQALEVRSSSDVYLAPGFVSKALRLASGLGGSIAASQLSAEQLSISAAGLAKITVEGTFGDVSVQAQGASSVLIAGLEKKATLKLGGLPNVAITATDAGASIVGTSEGSQVLYNRGTCSVKGAMAGGTICVKEAGLKISASPLRWTCNAALTGSSMCHTAGSSASTFSSTGDCSIMSWEAADKASSGKPAFARKLRQTSITSAISSSTSSGGSTQDSTPSSYTYSTTTTSSNGTPSSTTCSFKNGVGGCQVDGTPVPVQQISVDFPPSPSPAVDPLGDPSAVNVVKAATAASTIGAATSTTTGGYSCVFVNGVGGCQSGG